VHLGVAAEAERLPLDQQVPEMLLRQRSLVLVTRREPLPFGRARGQRLERRQRGPRVQDRELELVPGLAQ
jgi:hypothetical protein